MPRSFDSQGPIEAFCQRADAPSSRRSMLMIDEIAVGDRVQIFFAGDDTKPPYALKISAPTGATIVDRIVRDLPTGRPQSEPPVEFVISTKGDYSIHIKEVTGKSWGQATLHVAADPAR